MWQDLLQFEFLQNAVLISLLGSILGGIIGSYIVVKRVVSVSGGISHAAFGGIGLGFWLGFDPLWGAIGFSVLASLIIAVARERFKTAEDTLIGILWAVGMALGIMFLSLTPGYAPDLFSYLFGNILTVPRYDLYRMAAVTAVVILFFVLFYKDLFVVALDEEFARLRGRPVGLLNAAIWIVIGMTVVFLIKVVGIVLVISVLTIPAATARLFAKRFIPMMGLATIVGVLYCLVGLWLSYRFDLTSGATIILVSAVGYLLALALHAGRR